LNWLRVIAYLSLLLLIFPVIALLYWGLGPLSDPLGFGSEVRGSIILSLFASSIAVLVIFVLFTPLAYYLSRYESPFAETLSDLPAMVPHPVIGIALVVIDSPLTPTGRFLLSIGVNFFNSMLGLVTALTIVSAPLYIKSVLSYFDSMDRSAENFAMSLGASRLRAYLSVVLPASGRGIMTASLISLSRAMSEFGSIAIVAFAILDAPGFLSGSSAASVTVYQYYSYYGLNAAVTASASMILVSIPIMVAARLVRGRSSSIRRWI
jgi:molybdate/tungstate transport system permease protein